MNASKKINPLHTDIGLENIDPLDIDLVLEKLQISLHIKFDNTELKQVRTFGELCDMVVNKVEGRHTNDCTTQQAFYKIRKAIIATQQCDKDALKRDTKLEELFPRKQRRQQIRKFEHLLGIKTQILHTTSWVSFSLLFLFLVSFVTLFFSSQTGFAGMVLSIIGIYISNKSGRALSLKTIGQLAEKISREHYNKVRRNPTTINRAEIAQKVKELFKEDLGLEDHALIRDARFS